MGFAGMRPALAVPSFAYQRAEFSIRFAGKRPPRAVPSFSYGGAEFSTRFRGPERLHRQTEAFFFARKHFSASGFFVIS